MRVMNSLQGHKTCLAVFSFRTGSEQAQGQALTPGRQLPALPSGVQPCAKAAGSGSSCCARAPARSCPGAVPCVPHAPGLQCPAPRRAVQVEHGHQGAAWPQQQPAAEGHILQVLIQAGTRRKFELHQTSINSCFQLLRYKGPNVILNVS